MQLTDEHIRAIAKEVIPAWAEWTHSVLAFARAIESAALAAHSAGAQEPRAWLTPGNDVYLENPGYDDWTPLYTQPQADAARGKQECFSELKARMLKHIANNDWHKDAISPETIVGLIELLENTHPQPMTFGGSHESAGTTPIGTATASEMTDAARLQDISFQDWYGGLSPQWKRVIEAVDPTVAHVAEHPRPMTQTDTARDESPKEMLERMYREMKAMGPFEQIKRQLEAIAARERGEGEGGA